MRIRVNGVWTELEAATVGDVLAHYGLEGKHVVTEANGEIIDLHQRDATPLTEGMVLEIVHFVGGG